MADAYVLRRGTYKGQLITAVSDGYLQWMVSERVLEADQAIAEIERRQQEKDNAEKERQAAQGGNRSGAFEISPGGAKWSGALRHFDATRPLS
jgi:hypothetical protein